VSQMVQSA